MAGSSGSGWGGFGWVLWRRVAAGSEGAEVVHIAMGVDKYIRGAWLRRPMGVASTAGGRVGRRAQLGGEGVARGETGGGGLGQDRGQERGIQVLGQEVSGDLCEVEVRRVR